MSLARKGLTLAGSKALAQAAANFLIESDHIGRRNNGLLIPLPGANGMGLHYLGYTPEATLDIMANPPKALIVAQAELLDDDPAARAWLSQVETIIYANFFDDGISEIGRLCLADTELSPSAMAASSTASGACSAFIPRRVRLVSRCPLGGSSADCGKRSETVRFSLRRPRSCWT